jgi:uncharacterized protein GlcG (DUF336 family)
MSKYVLALGLAMLVSGCSDNSVSCTDELRTSVGVTVLDAEGEPVSNATLTYTVDDAAARDCSPLDPGYTCGIEEEGRFVITAVRGDESGEVRVTVRADECHVDPERVTIMLDTLENE